MKNEKEIIDYRTENESADLRKSDQSKRKRVPNETRELFLNFFF